MIAIDKHHGDVIMMQGRSQGGPGVPLTPTFASLF